MATTKKAKSRRRDRPSPRVRLLASATNLFTTEGIRVIGIDRILREADVAKASLYSLFGSKDNLVIAYINEMHEQWVDNFAARTANIEDPERQIEAFFDQVIEQQEKEGFPGSHFTHAASEYPNPETESEHNIVGAVMEHRQWLFDTLTSLLTQRNGYPSQSIARQLMILIDGGITNAQHLKSREPLDLARTLAKQLLGEPAADYSI